MRVSEAVVVLLCSPAVLCAQGMLTGNRAARFAKLFDESPEGTISGCEVRHLRPQLNYGFRFVSGYMGRWPMKHYEGNGHRFAVLTRVTPDDPEHKPALLAQFFQAPPAPPKSGSFYEVDGAFFLGEGGYTVDWLISDRDGRTCRKKWHLDAKIPRRDEGLEISQEANSIAPLRYQPWTGVPDRVRESGQPLRATILLHVAPLSMRRNKLHPYDETMLLSSLLSLLQRTRFTEIKLVAFNLDQQKELFRTEHFDAYGWSKLLDGIEGLELGSVPYSVLQKPQGHIDMVRELMAEEIKAEQRADAVIFLGPTSRHNEKVRLEEEAGVGKPPFYYFEFKPFWDRGAEFPDIFTHAVRALQGKVSHIYSPHDFAEAIKGLKCCLPD